MPHHCFHDIIACTTTSAISSLSQLNWPVYFIKFDAVLHRVSFTVCMVFVWGGTPWRCLVANKLENDTSRRSHPSTFSDKKLHDTLWELKIRAANIQLEKTVQTFPWFSPCDLSKLVLRFKNMAGLGGRAIIPCTSIHPRLMLFGPSSSRPSLYSPIMVCYICIFGSLSLVEDAIFQVPLITCAW